MACESPICVLQFKSIIYEDIKNWYFGNKGRVQTAMVTSLLLQCCAPLISKYFFFSNFSGSKKIFDLDDDDSFKSPYEEIVKPLVKKAGKVSDVNERFSRLTALSQGNLLKGIVNCLDPA